MNRFLVHWSAEMAESVWPDGKTSSDWYDIAGLLMEMEEAWGVSATITFQSAGKRNHPDLLMTLSTEMQLDAGAELARSVCVRYLASRQHLASLKALITFGLYQADFESEHAKMDKEDPF